jgi:heptosyltransferase-3
MTYGNYPDLQNVKKILVVKLRQLGDVLLTSAVFNVLRNRFPDSQIHAYVYTEAFAVLEGHRGVDALIGYDRKWKKGSFWQRWKKELALWKKIRQENYDLVINLTEGDRGAFVAKISKATIRVGFEPKGRWQKSFYTHVVKHCPTLRHTVERNLDALRKVGIFPNVEERELFFSISDSTLNRMVERVGKEPFILIHPSSRWRFKCWGVEKMRGLTQELIKRGKRIVFTSGPDAVERQMVAEIVKGLDVIDLSGSLDLKELGALIELSELLVCVDSVPFHIASALKKRVVALFGPTSEITWGPWRNPYARVVTKKMSCRPCYQDGCGGSKMSDCLVTLSVQDVLGAIDETTPVVD